MKKSGREINIILIGKDKDSNVLLGEALRIAFPGPGSLRIASGIPMATKLCQKKRPSVIFIDADSEHVANVLPALINIEPSVPLIPVISKKNYKRAFAWLEQGVADFILKTKYEPAVLEKTVRLAIRNQITAESLRHSNERYELVSMATNDMVWDWDLLNNKVFRSAEGWDKVFGTSTNNESVIADSWWDRVHPDDKKSSNSVIEKVLKDKELRYFEIECRVLRNDNTYATVVDRGYVLRNANGEVTRLIGATQDITDKKAAEQKLAAERRERQDEITKAVITAQEQERSHLGKELHDNINQILATSKLYIEYALANEEKREDMLNNAKNLVESAVAEIRNLSKTLLPSSLGEVGLTRAINDLVETMRPVSGFAISVSGSRLKEENIPEELKLTVYRIVQEQLSNISKHAFAKKVSIVLKNSQKKLEVCIKDNGRGFDLKQKMNGVGIKNIFSRARLHNGKAEIITEKGKGCTLNLIFKLPAL